MSDYKTDEPATDPNEGRVCDVCNGAWQGANMQGDTAKCFHCSDPHPYYLALRKGWLETIDSIKEQHARDIEAVSDTAHFRLQALELLTVKLKATEVEIGRRGQCMEELLIEIRHPGSVEYDNWFDSDGKVKPYSPIGKNG